MTPIPIIDNVRQTRRYGLVPGVGLAMLCVVLLLFGAAAIGGALWHSDPATSRHEGR